MRACAFALLGCSMIDEVVGVPDSLRCARRDQVLPPTDQGFAAGGAARQRIEAVSP
jgi:hypothetical protein